MQISYAWLTALLGADPGLDRVVERLTLGGLEVEHLARHGAHLDDVVVARVVSSRAHPSSKNPLTLVTVDAGDGVAQEIVCGASNVPAPGGLVCFARVGAMVFDKNGAPFTLEARPVAGVQSAGMLCAEDELGLGDDHKGILVLDGVAPGTRLSELPGLRDTVLTLNVTPNRGDALSHWGIAREVAALLDLPFAIPEVPHAIPRLAESVGALVQVEVLDHKGCPRYGAAVVRGITVKPSPLDVRVRLHRLGVRPINNVVDVTNLVMLETGQPLHAFDRDALRGHRIGVRRANEGETLQTLDGVDRALTGDDVLITDGEGPVALAGVMGGERSGVAETTRDVVIECAAFDPRAVRRTARRLGMRTESSHRFERGTDIARLPAVLAHTVSWMCHLGGGAAAQGSIDVVGELPPRRVIPVRAARMEALLGVDIARDEATAILGRLGCDTTATATGWDVTVPDARNDLHREVDLIEEVVRVWGVDRIPAKLPNTRGARAGATRDWSLRRRLRGELAALGLDEAIHMVFVSPRDVTSLGFDEASAVRLLNPLSEERSLLRPSLLPRLVAAAQRARRHGESRVRLFELGSVFGHAPVGADLPDETTRLAVILSGPRDTWLTRADDVDFYDLKGLVEELVERATGVAPTFTVDPSPPAWAHPRRQSLVRVGDAVLGTIAALHPDVAERWELGRAPVALEFSIAPLARALKAPAARAPSRFPSVRRDVALQLPKTVPAGDVAARLRAQAGPQCESVTLFDRYEGPELPAGTHSLAFALTFRADDRSLVDTEVDAMAERAVADARAAFDAARR